MNLMGLGLADMAGTIVAFFLTLMVLSYLIGDNALFRTALHIFIGVASGYAVVVAWYNVIWPQLLIPLIYGSQSQRLFVLFPLVLGGTLLFKISPRLSRIGNPAVAYLVGVGVAVAIGGSVLGTIFPQIGATVNLFDLGSIQPNENFLLEIIKGSAILMGTATTLIYFHFGVRSKSAVDKSRPRWLEVLGWIGQVFIAITLGVIFAGVYSAALTALIERLYFIGDFLYSLFTG